MTNIAIEPTVKALLAQKLKHKLMLNPHYNSSFTKPTTMTTERHFAAADYQPF